MPKQNRKLKKDGKKMSDWKNKTDFEINVKVAKTIGLLVKEEPTDESIGFTKGFHDKYPSTIWAAHTDTEGKQCDKWEQFNYCASWADMGPILHRHLVSLTFNVKTGQCLANIGMRAEYCIHTNPLRAAAIVFLEMNEANS